MRRGLAIALISVQTRAISVQRRPANALDPAVIVEVRGLLRTLVREHGVTVFVSSHILADRIGIVHIERADGRLRVFDAEGRVPEIARALVGAGLDITDLTPVREDLEAHFLRLTGGAR